MEEIIGNSQILDLDLIMKIVNYSNEITVNYTDWILGTLVPLQRNVLKNLNIVISPDYDFNVPKEIIPMMTFAFLIKMVQPHLPTGLKKKAADIINKFSLTLINKKTLRLKLVQNDGPYSVSRYLSLFGLQPRTDLMTREDIIKIIPQESNIIVFRMYIPGQTSIVYDGRALFDPEYIASHKYRDSATDFISDKIINRYKLINKVESSEVSDFDIAQGTAKNNNYVVIENYGKLYRLLGTADYAMPFVPVKNLAGILDPKLDTCYFYENKINEKFKDLDLIIQKNMGLVNVFINDSEKITASSLQEAVKYRLLTKFRNSSGPISEEEIFNIVYSEYEKLSNGIKLTDIRFVNLLNLSQKIFKYISALENNSVIESEIDHIMHLLVGGQMFEVFSPSIYEFVHNNSDFYEKRK